MIHNGAEAVGRKTPGGRLQWAAERIESAVKEVLAAGLRTPDIWSEDTTKVSTRQMGDAVVVALMGRASGATAAAS